MIQELKAVVKAKIADMEERRKPVFAARAAARAVAQAPAPFKASPGSVLHTLSKYTTSFWTSTAGSLKLGKLSDYSWQNAAVAVVACAVVYALLAERKGIAQCVTARVTKPDGNSSVLTFSKVKKDFRILWSTKDVFR